MPVENTPVLGSDVDTGFPFPTFHSSAKEHPVLWDFDHYNELMEMPLPVIRTGTQNMGNGVYWLKAGTPLSEAGAVANTSAAICVVAEDFYFYENKPNQAKLVKVIVHGYVDLAEAEARSGLTYTEDALSALETAGIVMVDGKLPASGGGGGGLPPYTNADLGKSLALVNSSETTTIIQSQSVECVPAEYGCIGHLAEGTYDFSFLAAGDTVALTVDGVTEHVEAELGPESSLFLPGTDLGVFCDTGEVFLSGESTVTVTISAATETARAVPSWRGSLIVHRVEGTAKATSVFRLDKTWKEIYEAFLAGGVVVTYSVNDDPIYVSVCSVGVNNGNYVVGVSAPSGGAAVLYSTTSENDYPRAST